MISGVTLFILTAVIITIWIFVEVKRMRHKLFAIALIAIILLAYASATYTLKEKDIDYGTISGIMQAGKIYFTWLGSAFTNVKSITSNAIKMDWKGNETNNKS